MPAAGSCGERPFGGWDELTRMLQALLQPLEVLRHLLRCLPPDHERDKEVAYPAALELETDRDVRACAAVERFDSDVDARSDRAVDPPDGPGARRVDLGQLGGRLPLHESDPAAPLVARARPALWRIASALPGGAYRRYYLHLTPEGVVRATQLSALWALWFYFGSVVRYRPHSFDRMIAGRYGAYLTEFVAAQPEQLLYLLASELCQREVAKPAIA